MVTDSVSHKAKPRGFTFEPQTESLDGGIAAFSVTKPQAEYVTRPVKLELYKYGAKALDSESPKGRLVKIEQAAYFCILLSAFWPGANFVLEYSLCEPAIHSLYSL